MGVRSIVIATQVILVPIALRGFSLVVVGYVIGLIL